MTQVNPDFRPGVPPGVSELVSGITAIYAHNWRMLALRGLIAILFGIVAMAAAPLTVAGFVVLFGVYAILDGISSIVSGMRRYRNERRWGAPVAIGLLGIAAGIVAFRYPAATALAMVFVFAGFLIARGAFELATAITLRDEIRGEFWLGLAGVISMIFGFWMAMAPGLGVLAMVGFVAAYAILYGATMLALSFRLKKVSETMAARLEAPEERRPPRVAA